jgi:hypothetical protein
MMLRWVWGFLFLFLLSRRAGIDGQFNLVWPREKNNGTFPSSFSVGYSKLKKNRNISRLRISPYRLLKNKENSAKRVPLQNLLQLAEIHKVHMMCAHKKI